MASARPRSAPRPRQSWSDPARFRFDLKGHWPTAPARSRLPFGCRGKRSNGGRGGSSRYLPGRRGARIPSRPGRARGPSRRRPCAPCHSACRQSRTAAPSCRRMATAFHRQGWSFPRRPRHRGGRRPAGAGPAAGRRPRGRPGRSDPHAARPCPIPARGERGERSADARSTPARGARPFADGAAATAAGTPRGAPDGRTRAHARRQGPPVRLRTGARPGSGVRCRLHDQPLPPGPNALSPPAVVRKATRQADAFVEALGQAGRSALTGSGDGVAGVVRRAAAIAVAAPPGKARASGSKHRSKASDRNRSKGRSGGKSRKR